MINQRRPRRCPCLRVMVLGVLTLPLARLTVADEAGDLSRLGTDVLTKEQRSEAAGMIDRDIERRAAEVNARHRAAWSKIETREQWETVS